jgi:hypothetical protein
MKMKGNILLGLFLIFILTSCPNITSGPEIEWISGGTSITYTYSGGSVSGYYFHRSFEVVGESGEVTIEVKIQDDESTLVSHTFQVEKGNQYSIKVKGNKDGSSMSSPGSNCLTVEFSSPNCRSTQEISIDSYLVPGYNDLIGDTYYCPDALSFEDIILSE